MPRSSRSPSARPVASVAAPAGSSISTKSIGPGTWASSGIVIATISRSRPWAVRAQMMVTSMAMRMTPQTGYQGRKAKAVMALTPAMSTPIIRASRLPERMPTPSEQEEMPTSRWIHPQVVASNWKVHFGPSRRSRPRRWRRCRPCPGRPRSGSASSLRTTPSRSPSHSVARPWFLHRSCGVWVATYEGSTDGSSPPSGDCFAHPQAAGEVVRLATKAAWSRSFWSA